MKEDDDDDDEEMVDDYGADEQDSDGEEVWNKHLYRENLDLLCSLSNFSIKHPVVLLLLINVKFESTKHCIPQWSVLDFSISMKDNWKWYQQQF